MTAAAITLAGRLAAEALMVDACSITRRTGVTSLSETTGRETAAAGTSVYVGKCRVQRRDLAAQSPEVAQRTATVQVAQLQLPASATGIRVGDVATITACVLDPDLVGRVFRVTGLANKSHATARRLQVEEVTG